MSNEEPTQPGDFARWRLEVARHIIRGLAEFASVSVFGWWKEPGNSYITFCPTALMPDPDDEERRLSPELASEIFAALVKPEQQGPCLTIAHYGNGLEIPAWAHPDGQQVELGAYTEDPEAVAARALEHLDIDFLTSIGSPDPDSTAVVDAWLNQAIEELREHPEKAMSFGTERPTFRPMGMWVIELDLRDEIWWPDRKHLLLKW
jgi:hypothetical protein